MQGRDRARNEIEEELRACESELQRFLQAKIVPPQSIDDWKNASEIRDVLMKPEVMSEILKHVPLHTIVAAADQNNEAKQLLQPYLEEEKLRNPAYMYDDFIKKFEDPLLDALKTSFPDAQTEQVYECGSIAPTLNIKQPSNPPVNVASISLKGDISNAWVDFKIRNLKSGTHTHVSFSPADDSGGDFIFGEGGARLNTPDAVPMFYQYGIGGFLLDWIRLNHGTETA
jgi:hypothetical protein